MSYPGYLTYLLMVTFLSLLMPQVSHATEGKTVAYSLRVAQETLIKDQRRFSSNLFTLGGMTKIAGLVYDLDSKDIIVIGEKDAQRAPLTLDDFVVALRARFIYGQWPSVSIGPPENPKKTGSSVVRFEGGIENTPLGKDLFEASLQLKQIALGLLPTDPPISWDVNHKRLEELSVQNAQIHSRFWLYPSLHDVIVKDNVAVIRGLRASVVIDVLSVEVDKRRLDNLSPFQGVAGEQFAQGISDHFQELTKVHPAFSRLQGLNELLALASVIEELEPPPDLSFWLKRYRAKQKRTDREIEVLKRQMGDRRYQVQLTGGVQLRSMVIRPETEILATLGFELGTLTELKNDLLQMRPESDSLSWSLEDSFATESDTTAKLFAEAASLSENAQYDEAIQAYERIAQLAPDTLHKVLLGKAFAMRKKGLALWGTEARVKPDRSLGDDFIQKSISLLKDCIRIKPTFSECHYELGATFYDLGNIVSAIQHFKEAIRHNPRFYFSHYGLGLALYKMEQDDEAIAHLQEYLKHDSSGQYAVHARNILKKAEKSVTELKTYKNAEKRILFRYPASWTVMTPEEVTAKTQGIMKTEGAVVFVLNSRDFDQNANIKSYAVSKDSLSTAELGYLEKLLDREYPKQFPGFRKISARVLTLSGVQALAYVMDTDRMGKPFRQKSVLVIKGRKDYVLTFTAPRESFKEADSSCFQIILDTLEIR